MPGIGSQVFTVLPPKGALVKFSSWPSQVRMAREGALGERGRASQNGASGSSLGTPSLELKQHVIPFLHPHPTPSESYSVAGSEGSVSASAASGLAAPSGPSSGLSSGPCSPSPPRAASGLRRWLDHSKHCLTVETEADSGRAGPHEVSRAPQRHDGHPRGAPGEGGWCRWSWGDTATVPDL